TTPPLTPRGRCRTLGSLSPRQTRNKRRSCHLPTFIPTCRRCIRHGSCDRNSLSGSAIFQFLDIFSCVGTSVNTTQQFGSATSPLLASQENNFPCDWHESLVKSYSRERTRRSCVLSSSTHPPAEDSSCRENVSTPSPVASSCPATTAKTYPPG